MVRPALILALIAICSFPAAPAEERGPDAGYVGDEACGGCHKREAATFPETAMGRSFSLPDAILHDREAVPAEGVTFLNERSHRRYRVFIEDGALKHREIRLDEMGDEVFELTRTVTHVLGSGDRGQTFLFQSGNRLEQSAIAFRRSRDGWGMAAGFESLHQYPMTRPVTAPCLFCHANRADHIEGTLNEFREPMFDGLAIGCERCHGPGAEHVAVRRSTPPSLDGVDPSIVNPARLEPRLRDHVCYQCHLQGAARIVKAGRQPHDYRPGRDLSETFAVFHEETGAAGSLEVVSHVERLRASRCWNASGGDVNCLTCHDPHRTPRGGDAIAQFRDACLGCHAQDACGLDPGSRAAAGDPEDCVRCHMAKLPPSDAPHTLFTDHKIARRISPPQEGAPHRDGSVNLVNFLEGSRGSQRDLGLAHLHHALHEALPEHADRGLAILEPLLGSLKDDIAALRMMAQIYIARGRSEDAGRLLGWLVARAPQVAEFGVQLARLERAAGRREHALSLVRRVVAEDPSYAPGRLTLGDLLSDAGAEGEALAEYRAAVALDPTLGAAHARLGDFALADEDEATARREYRIALSLDPGLLSPRLRLASLHLEAGQIEEALTQLRVGRDHSPWGPTRDAVRLDLALTLARAGRLDEARSELAAIVSEAPEGEAADRARELLESLPRP